jgi:putative ABC transport system substrate-binding protein
MKRREFITLLAASAWPLAARAQQSDRMRRVGVLMVVAETDPDAKRLVEALETRLDAAGWHKGRNLEITYRWGADDPEQLARYANELVLSAPDVLVPFGTAALMPLRRATTTIPIVFTAVSDPRGAGIRGKPCPSWRKHYRIFQLRAEHRQQMGATAQGDRPICNAGRRVV